MKIKIMDKTYWKELQSAVISAKVKNIVPLSYFDSEEDKDYFIKTYKEDFDDVAISAIESAKPTELIRISKSNENYETSPFNSLILPKYINEAFILKVNYLADKKDEEFSPEDELKKDYIDSYEVDDDYGMDNNYEEEPEFEDEEVIDYTKIFVFAIIDDEFKYMGCYVLE
jgi:hypothetical protein